MPIVTVITTTKEPEVLCSVQCYQFHTEKGAAMFKQMLKDNTEDVEGHNIYIDVMQSG